MEIKKTSTVIISKHKSNWNPTQVLKFGHSTELHCDVEIKTQGGWTIKAHSFHLAACSKFLKQCLKQVVPGKFPTLYLPDVKPSVVQGLLTFIYTGDVYLNQEDTDDFFSTAKMLNIEAVNELAMSDFEKRQVKFQTRCETTTIDVGFDSAESPTDFQESAFESFDNNTIYIPQENDEDGMVSESDNPLNDDDNPDQWTKELAHDIMQKKQHQIVCHKNLPFFKAKLYSVLSNLYRAHDVDIEVIKPELEMKLNMNPRRVRSKTECPLCNNNVNVSARLTKDKKRFIQWNICHYRKHIEKHVQEKTDNVLGHSVLPTEGPFKQETADDDYGNYEITSNNETHDDADDTIFIETELDQPSPTEYYPGSIVVKILPKIVFT